MGVSFAGVGSLAGVATSVGARGSKDTGMSG